MIACLKSFRRLLKKVSLLTIGSVGFFLLHAQSVSAQVTTDYDVSLGDRDLVDIIITIINVFLGLLSLIAVIMIIYGGVIWLTAGGREERIEKAKLILRNAVIGLVIVLLSWAIVTWIIGIFQDAANGDDTAKQDGTSGGSIPSSDSGFYVLSTDPEQGETGANLCAVQVRMSDYVDKDTVTEDTFYLHVLNGAQNGAACSANNACASGSCVEGACVGDAVAGTIGFGPGESTKNFNFLPEKDFEMKTTYEAVIEGGADGILSDDPNDDGIDDRISMSASYTWSFTTGEEKDEIPPTVEVNCVDTDGDGIEESCNSPFPADGETNVCTNTVINFDFSEPMLVSSFNDDTSFLLASSGTKESPSAPDWATPLGLDNWNFGGDFDYGQARPAETLQSFALYSTRLSGGDAENEFFGALTDYCGNPLDGDSDGTAEGSTIDNFYGFDPEKEDAEGPITWETGENAECTPVIESINPGYDYYGEDAKLREGDSCIEDNECGSGTCENDKCVGYAPNTLTISGLYLGPHPEVRLEGSVIWASENFNTCFDTDHLGNVQTNTAVGDYCLEDKLQTTSQIQMRTPVGAGDTPIQVSVAEEISEPSATKLDVLSPYIATIDPKDGSIGQYITISGQNFGSTIGTVTMRSADGSRTSVLTLPLACGDVWTEDEIVVVAPEKYKDVDGKEGTWVSGDIAYIQVYNPDTERYSDLQQFQFSDIVRPNLCQVQPTCDNTAGKPFTVTGEGFNQEQGDNQVAFTSRTDELVYNASIDSWSDTLVSGNTNTGMPQSEYWVSVHDAATGLNSNGRKYEIACKDGPKVVTINQCDQANGIYPVPNPQPNTKDACINANIGVLFDQKISTATLNPQTVYLQQFNSGDDFNSAYKPINVEGYFQTKDWSYDYKEEKYYGFQYNISKTYADTDQNGAPELDNTSGYLQPNTWYQLTITNSVANESGVTMESNYIMRFKSDNTSDLCAVDSIDVAPSKSVQNSYWDYDKDDVSSESYTGSAYDAKCSLLDGDSYSWLWGIEDKNIGNFGSGPGNKSTQNVYVSGNDQENEGSTTVTTAVEEEEDTAKFSVDLAFCTSDADCSQCKNGEGQVSTCNLETSHCTPVIKNFTPEDGTQGTWATINGCMFGSAKGNVFWKGVTADSEPVPTAWPDSQQCGDTWTDTQIIAEVPESLKEQGHTITVESKYGDADTTSNTFAVNQTVHPGLCKIDPTSASEHDKVVATGKSFGTDEGYASFLTDDDYVEPEGPDRISGTADDTEWNEEEVFTRVPTGAVTGRSEKGQKGFMAVVAGGDEQCQDSTSCSNPKDFSVSCQSSYDCNSGCCSSSGLCREAEYCIENVPCSVDSDCQVNGCSESQCMSGKCSPDIKGLYNPSGPAGAPVTINGCYFSSYKYGKSGVTFASTSANLFCEDGWSNSQIIVEAPKDLQNGKTVPVVVTTKDGLTTQSDDPDALYSVTEQCYGGGGVPNNGIPLLCDLSPGTGQAASNDGSKSGEAIDFYGDHYIETDQKNIFYTEKVGDQFDFSSSTKTTASVPSKTQTGPAAPEVAQCRGNGLEFGVECVSAADCQSGQYCVDGICTSDSCGGCTPGTSDAVCGTTNGCYLNSSSSQYCCSSRPSFISSDPTDGQSNICPNRVVSLRFSEEITGYTSNIILEKVTYGEDGTVKSGQVVSAKITTNDQKTINVVPTNGWEVSKNYRVTVKSNPDKETGIVSKATSLALVDGDYSFAFATAANECQPSYIDLLNVETGEPSYTFNAPNTSTKFTVTMHASDGQTIEPTSTMGWEYTWSPYYDEDTCNKVAWVDITAEQDELQTISATSETQTITSGTENNGETAVTVKAKPTSGSSWEGELYDSAPLFVFFCAEDEMWEYLDTDSADSLRQNFRLLYCASDGLPKFNETPALSTDPQGNFIRQYLFTNRDNQDQAFGIRVYENKQYYSPAEWYQLNVPNPGSPKTVEIDGYSAVQDGSTYYIAATNIVDSKLYNNIYLITFNNEETTQQMSKQIMEYMKFNLNVDYAQCEGSDKNKLTRDANRITDMYSMKRLADQYYTTNSTYPIPQSASYGSYIDVMTTSVWPSWQGALGNQFGQSLPTDPYNFFYASDTDTPWDASSTPWLYEGEENVKDCKNEPDNSIYYDESGTCWDPINSKFFCPKNSYTYMWKSVRTNPDNRNQSDRAAIYAKFEYQSNSTEEYMNMDSSTDACSDISNAECACYNYTLELNP